MQLKDNRNLPFLGLTGNLLEIVQEHFLRSEYIGIKEDYCLVGQNKGKLTYHSNQQQQE